ncbi:MAG: hypothetical protein ORO02_01805 [Bacteroidia bacterium]|nr:hypothetical protein [Bacteroidia bacterium]
MPGKSADMSMGWATEGFDNSNKGITSNRWSISLSSPRASHLTLIAPELLGAAFAAVRECCDWAIKHPSCDKAIIAQHFSIQPRIFMSDYLKTKRTKITPSATANMMIEMRFMPCIMRKFKLDLLPSCLRKVKYDSIFLNIMMNKLS